MNNSPTESIQYSDTKSFGIGTIAGNLASVIAVLAVFVLICSFWLEISLEDVLTVNFAMDSCLTALLYCVMQFSMQENGRKSGALDPTFREAQRKYRAVRDRLLDGGVTGLEELCIEYAEQELKFARSCRLARIGLDLDTWQREYSSLDRTALRSRTLTTPDGKRPLSRLERRVILATNRMRPIRLTPSMLLLENGSRLTRDIIAQNPEKKLALTSACQALTTVVAGCFTASILVEVVSAPTVATFVYCLIKLFCLLWRGAMGYSAGYKSICRDAVAYHSSRTSILTRFEAAIRLKETKSEGSVSVCLTKTDAL